MDQLIIQITNALSLHPNLQKEPFQYGTAGFRMLALKLDSVVFVVGILASLRSKKLGRTIGVMITASHNPPLDNGVKVVDPMGDMLDQGWEKYATELANTVDVVKCVKEIISLENIDVTKKSSVVIGRDSRDSGPQLLKATIDGLRSLDTEVHDFGLLTTPQLHYLTRSFNDLKFGEKSEDGYYEKLTKAYSDIIDEPKTPIHIVVDAANGIGAAKVELLQKSLSKYINFELINGQYDKPELLNMSCGADYIKTNQKLPAGLPTPIANDLYCSFDGDADRIVFYYVDTEGEFHLLDGDKIATLIANYFVTVLREYENDLSIGIIQTAYANGSSTNFIKQSLKIPVEFTATGVKHLHHKAQEYDIGIYFEANGHGTVLFSDKFIQYAQSHSKKLSLLVNLINQTVGDAISDLLAVLVICQDLQLTPQQWDSMYLNLPNKLAKVVVGDRNQFTTTDAERKLVTPFGLQDEIDTVVSKFADARSFVRASGTEDAVRVYAEALTEQQCSELSNEVVSLVSKYGSV